jgi:hypothetical protein
MGGEDGGSGPDHFKFEEPLEDVEEEVAIADELEEETQPPKLAAYPHQPTDQQLERHRCEGHQPYRSWCKWCVQGRGRGLQHRAGGGPSIPRIGLAYLFITSGGLKTKPELLTDNDASGEG